MSNSQDDQSQPDSARGVTRDLASRIASAKREREREDNRSARDASPEMSGLARGMRIGTEFIAAVLVGAGLGYLIDLGLGTSPWGLLILRRWNPERHPSGGGNECRLASPAGVRSRARRGRRRAG
jgi:ATP synthase protein I